MNVKSDGGTKQHHYTTKSITIPYVPNGKSRDRVGAENPIVIYYEVVNMRDKTGSQT